MTGPLPGFWQPIAWPASLLYGLGVGVRNRSFDRGQTVERVEMPVISIGNVTAGGSGKSPMVRHVVSELLALGRAPAIAMRGYRAAPGTLGDEAEEYQRLCPDVPVIVDADRARGIRSAQREAAHAFDVVVLDDGFQHRRLHRDLDVVLVDVTRDGLDGPLLPAGWLREPASALQRADIIILTRTDAADPEHVDAVAQRVERAHGAPAVARTRHAWESILVIEAGVERQEPVSWLRGQAVVTSLGIGNPEPMLAALRQHGVEVRTEVPARDHQPYDMARCQQLARLASGTDGLVVTVKDLVKIDRAAFNAVRLIVPIVGIEFTDGREAVRSRLAAIR